MKLVRILLLITVALFTTNTLYGQEKEEVREWYQVQKKAEFPGGEAAMDAFINDKIPIPDKAYKKAKSGTVIVHFIVEKNGKLSDIRIISKTKIGYGVEEAVMDVFKKMPRWEPAIQRDKLCRMAFSKPIRLELN